MTRQLHTVAMSAAHHRLLRFIVTFLSITRKENNKHLVERLIVAYAKQMTATIKDDVVRGKLIELINHAEAEQPTDKTKQAIKRDTV